ncbi:hypothetical protein R50072_36990 [Simiduia litorea]|uniref:hypothetical protein n=1 Tax=Simiduia litorea TaxID=1435348 RepID=UPI0036F41E79
MTKLHLFILASEVISICLLLRLWSKPDYLVFKILISVVTVVPFVGPVLYFFATDKTMPQSTELQNRGPRGDYTHKQISLDAASKNTANKGKFANDGT